MRRTSSWTPFTAFSGFASDASEENAASVCATSSVYSPHQLVS